MDIIKCARLKETLSQQPAPQLVAIDQFLDGNDDLGSIGCNLPDHPGIAAFRDTFAALERRPDVNAIIAQIAELDPGEDMWPFADTVFIIGAIPAAEAWRILAHLQPDEVYREDDHSQLPPTITETYSAPIAIAWWD